MAPACSPRTAPTRWVGGGRRRGRVDGVWAAGIPTLTSPTPIPLAALATAGQQRQLQQFQAKATRMGATRYRQNEGDICGSPLTAEQLGQREPYLDVRQRSQRSAVPCLCL